MLLPEIHFPIPGIHILGKNKITGVYKDYDGRDVIHFQKEKL
jgi:hypothetical protein